MSAQVTVVFNKSNHFGLERDAEILQTAWRKVAGKIRFADPLEPPVLSDVLVHLEVPSYGWMPWGRMNVLVVNPEWWEDAWNPFLFRFDALFFKTQADRETFLTTHQEHLAEHTQSFTIPWMTNKVFKPLTTIKPKPTALWLLGASVNKRAAAQHVLPLWKEDWPSLDVYTTQPLDLSGAVLASSVRLHVEDLSEEERDSLQLGRSLHVILSRSEALGLAAAEGQLAGAFLLGNQLPSYTDLVGESVYSYLVPADLVPLKAGVQDTFTYLTQEALQKGIDTFRGSDLVEGRQAQQTSAKARWKACDAALLSAAESLVKGERMAAQKKVMRTLPPVLSADEVPHISIVTLLYNRRKFVDLAMHNLLITNYPKDKIEWIVVEDSDKVEEQASDKIIKFGREAAPMSVSYIPLAKKTPIGKKRNIGIEKAQHDIVLMMDDDDHYPPTSFMRRVSWLIKHPWAPQCVAATTIACYDLMKGTSAVNTPPWSLPLKQRISEATLCFRKSWWAAQKFPEVPMAEGEGLLEGREGDVVELAPQQIIVAMSHGLNSSSRKIPPGPSGKPSCFWGFPKEFLTFLHGLVGVQIET